MRGRRRLGDDGVESRGVDGATFWFVPGDRAVGPPNRGCDVLQGYDEYGVAFTEGRVVTNVARLDLDLPPATLIHLLVMDSQVLGYWRRFVRRGGLDVQVRVARPLGARQRSAVEAAFAQFARFTGGPVDVQWT